MPIPIVYRKPSQTPTVYDFVDIQDGTGIIIYYLGTHSKSSIGTGDNKELSGGLLFPQTFYSADIETENQTVGTTNNAQIIFNFLTPEFNRPMILKGTARFEAYRHRGSTGSDNVKFRDLKLTRVRDNVSTRISTTPDTSGSSLAPGTNISKADFIEIPIDGTQFFKIGDQLQFQGTFRLDNTGTDGQIFAFAHDPKNRDGTRMKPSINKEGSTVAKLFIPTKINT